MEEHMKKLLTTISLFAFISFQSHASLLLEPYLNYNFGSGDQGNTEYTTSGPSFGGKIGYQNLGFMLGLDASMGSTELESKSISGTSTYDMDNTRIGVFAGYDFPVLLRAWVGYFFKNSLEYSKAYTGISSGSMYNGSAIELGVGFTPLPLLSVNVGYRMNTWDEFESASGTTTSLSQNVEVNEIFLGVSLPLTF